MQLPHSIQRQKYNDEIKIIEANLKDATSGKLDSDLLDQVQKRLDKVASKYQYDEDIGTAQYKMYELQALVHYFKGNDEEALDFINQAIETRGESYNRAEKIKRQISDKAKSDNMTKSERRKKLIGLEGWMALFVVGIGASILLNIIGLFEYPSTFNSLGRYSTNAYGFAEAITPVLWFEIFTTVYAIFLGIWLLVQLSRHEKFAKNIAIIYLASVFVLSLLDYSWGYSIFNNFGLDTSSLSQSASDLGRTFIGACIWIPYFLVSKRVKATLTN